MNNYLVCVNDFRGTRPDGNKQMYLNVLANTAQEATDKVQKTCIKGFQNVVAVFLITRCTDWKI